MEEGIEQKVVKIVICGPESTGKSVLAQALAKHFNTSYSSEFLREFALAKYNKGQQLFFDENIQIAQGQVKLDKQAVKASNGKLYFADTDCLQTIVYSNIYYSKSQMELEDILLQNPADLYLFADDDIEWVPDILRDGREFRKMTKDLLLDELTQRNLRFEIINGFEEERIKSAIFKVELFLKK